VDTVSMTTECRM